MKFGANRRVRKRAEFLEIQSRARRVVTKHFVFIIARSRQADSPCRLGITASKRAGNSVRRSRLKRIVRAAFQRKNGMLPPGHDLVVICRFDEAHLGTDTVVQEWDSAKSRVHKALSQLESRSR